MNKGETGIIDYVRLRSLAVCFGEIFLCQPELNCKGVDNCLSASELFGTC